MQGRHLPGIEASSEGIEAFLLQGPFELCRSSVSRIKPMGFLSEGHPIVPSEHVQKTDGGTLQYLNHSSVSLEILFPNTVKQH